MANIDIAVGYTLVNRVWMLGSNALTMLLIVHFLSGAEQGLYFTFLTILGLHIVFDLGVSYTVTQWVARERVQLELLESGLLIGDDRAKERLALLVGQATKQVAGTAIAFFFSAIFIGVWLFSNDAKIPTEKWLVPWILVTCLTSLRIFLLSLEGAIEGLGKVDFVAKARLAGLVSGTTGLWAILISGGGLYAAVASAALMFFVPAWIYFKRYSSLFRNLARTASASNYKFSWRQEIWPFQWKLALTTCAGYIVLNLFNPAVYFYQGAEAAGRFGLGLSIANSVAGFMSVWLNCKVPLISALTAGEKYAELNALFKSTKQNTLAVALLAGIAALSLISLIKYIDPAVTTRIPDNATLLVLVFASALQQYILTVAVFARAQKQEPLLVPSVLVALITACILPGLAKHFGVFGAGIGFLIPTLLISVPFSYFTNRRVASHIGRQDDGLGKPAAHCSN